MGKAMFQVSKRKVVAIAAATNNAIPAHDITGPSVVINGGAVTKVQTEAK